MVKAKTKEELISFSEENWHKMCHLVDALPLEAQTATFVFGQEKGKEAHWGEIRISAMYLPIFMSGKYCCKIL